MTTAKQQNIATKTFLVITAVITALLIMLAVAKTAYAQEINPDASTYSYGSTSEFSPYAPLSTETLAQTGMDQTAGYVIAIGALVAAGVLMYFAKSAKTKQHA